jgi:gas vesicle protein
LAAQKQKGNGMTNTCEPKPERDMEVPCFLIGLGVGVALTLLFAPASGNFTRRRINRKVRDGKDWVQDQAEHISNTADELHDRMEDAAKRVGLA